MEAEAPAATLKREREEDEEPGGGAEVKGENGEPAAKRMKVEAAPMQLGFRTFSGPNEMRAYLSNLLKVAKTGQDLNEYEATVVLDLLKKGHPRAPDKLARGIRSIQVRAYRSEGCEATKCFHIVRPNGRDTEDFSYLKCLDALYPDNARIPPSGSSGGRGSGGRGGGDRRGGGGGGARGRGGRGRGRGRG